MKTSICSVSWSMWHSLKYYIPDILYISVFIQGGAGVTKGYWGGGGRTDPLQIWTKICQLYKCVINVNTGWNIVLEFTLKGLIF